MLQQKIAPLSRPIRVTFSRRHPHKDTASYHYKPKNNTAPVPSSAFIGHVGGSSRTSRNSRELLPVSRNVTGEMSLAATTTTGVTQCTAASSLTSDMPFLNKRNMSDGNYMLTGSVDMDATRLCYENFVKR